MKVLSLFDGISCGRLALERAGIQVDKYFASEIDKYAIQVSKKNWPDIIHIWDVKNIKFTDHLWYWEDQIIGRCEVDKIDLLIGGSPCQDLSIAKWNWKWLDGEKSSLFYEYVRILKDIRPKYFLLENVASMKKKDKDKITEVLLEIYPETEVHIINSALVSAQNRKRIYWTNIKNITQPKDKNIYMNDILLSWKSQNKSYCIPSTFYKENVKSLIKRNKKWLFVIDNEIIRKLSPIECERLQTLPDWYTSNLSMTQRYKSIWNGWTVDIISHILKNIYFDEVDIL